MIYALVGSRTKVSQCGWQLRFISQHFYLTLYSDDLMDSDTLC